MGSCIGERPLGEPPGVPLSFMLRGHDGRRDRAEGEAVRGLVVVLEDPYGGLWVSGDDQGVASLSRIVTHHRLTAVEVAFLGGIHGQNGTLPLMSATLLWHITELSTWETAQREGRFTSSTRGRSVDEVGFIHCCLPEQVSYVAKRVYPDQPHHLVILEIDVQRVASAGVGVTFEEDTIGFTGQVYPHIYGPLPLDTVLRIRRTKWVGREFVVVA